MADISSIQIGETTYEIKDSVARGGGGGSNTYTYYTANLSSSTTSCVIPANSVIIYFSYTIKGTGGTYGSVTSSFTISDIWSDSNRTTTAVSATHWCTCPVSQDTNCYLIIASSAGQTGSGSATIKYYTVT